MQVDSLFRVPDNPKHEIYRFKNWVYEPIVLNASLIETGAVKEITGKVIPVRVAKKRIKELKPGMVIMTQYGLAEVKDVLRIGDGYGNWDVLYGEGFNTLKAGPLSDIDVYEDIVNETV